jgi:hypothetical protein
MKNIVVGITAIIIMLVFSQLWDIHLHNKYSVVVQVSEEEQSSGVPVDFDITDEQQIIVEKLPKNQREEYIGMLKEQRTFDQLTQKLDKQISEIIEKKAYFDQQDDKAQAIIRALEQKLDNGIHNEK